MTAPRSSALRRSLAVAVGALALACGAAQADPHGGWHGGGGGYHGGYHGGGWHEGARWSYRAGWGWGWWDPLWPVGVGLGIGLATAPYSYYYDNPGYVVVNPAPGYYYPPAPVYVNPPAAVPAPAPAPRTADPIFYPRNGQSPAQTEADRQDCNRWATTQPNAMNDASIFQRATFACMEGRGYTVR